MQKDYANKKEIAARLYKIEAHPLNTFVKENAEMTKAIEDAEKELAGALGEIGGGLPPDMSANVGEISQGMAGKISKEVVQRLRQISVHYAKKGDLIYPHLKVVYDIAGPSDLMWTDDDEIRDTFAKVEKQISEGRLTEKRVELYKEALKEAKLMIMKEESILFPICAVNFSDEEWYQIYEDSKDYNECFGVDMGTWHEAEEWLAEHRSEGSVFKRNIQEQPQRGSAVEGEPMGSVAGSTGSNDSLGKPDVLIDSKSASYEEIHMPGGHMTVKQITEMLNTIPLELTFVDHENINRYFNEGPKIFKRPQMAIDRDVFSCHPPKIETMVRGIIEDFRNHRRDSVPVWMEKGGVLYLVTYFAVRDKDGEYLGVVETIQDMEFAKEYFYKKFKREHGLD